MKVIFDIDGTIADCTHRLHMIEGDKKEWEKFFFACVDDKPIYRILMLLDYLVTDVGSSNFIFCTSRPERTRKETVEWILTHTGFRMLSKDKLLMRGDNDRRPDTIVKPELLEKAGLTPDKVLFIVEDRTKVVNKLRELGYTVLQCASGDY